MSIPSLWLPRSVYAYLEGTPKNVYICIDEPDLQSIPLEAVTGCISSTWSPPWRIDSSETIII